MRSNKALTAAYWCLSAVVAVGLGILADSVIVGLVAFGGFYLVWIGCGAVETRKYRRASLATIAGAVMLVDAIWLGRVGDRWWWLPALLLVGLAVAAAASVRVWKRRPPRPSRAPDTAIVERAADPVPSSGDVGARPGAGPPPVRTGIDTEGGEAMDGGFDERPIWERDGADERPIWSDGDETAAEAAGDDTSAAVGEGLEHPTSAAVTALFDAGPLIDIALVGDDEFVVLGSTGDITLFRGGTAVGSKRVAMVRPLGLGATAAHSVAFVDGGGRILELSVDEGAGRPRQEGGPHPAGIAIVHSGVIEEADCFAVSPLGTLVVTASRERGRASCFFLAGETSHVLLDDVEPPSALGFSLDGRLVAIGSASGTVHLVDAGGRGLVSTLDGAAADGRPVVGVTGTADDGWLVAYDNERVAVWRGGEMLRTVDAGGPVTCLGVHPADGRVAAGTVFGFVRVLSPDLETRLTEARPFTSRVRRAFWAEGSAAIVCAGTGGEVRRLRPPA